MNIGNSCMGLSEPRIKADRLLKIRKGLLKSIKISAAPMVTAAEIRLVGFAVCGQLFMETCELLVRDMCDKRSCRKVRHAVLNTEQIIAREDK